MSKRIITTAGLFGALAVALGAFGAHGLKSAISADALVIWEKGVQYQFYHTFALLFLAFAGSETSKAVRWAYGFFVAGIVLFSGSLYILALRGLMDVGLAGIVGPITPLGGVCFILGWVALFWVSLKDR
jgi:uncharacterized membrane protein YgdD (TMEM256/DUF423 family)